MSTTDAPRASTAQAAGVGRRSSGTRTRKGPSVLVPVLLILVGIAITIYPIVATFYNDYHQHAFASKYNTAVAAVGPQQISDQLARAQEYNANLPEKALGDPWSHDQGINDAHEQNYRSQLNVTDAMARIRIPKLGIDLPIYHGTDDATLAKGVGHMYGSTLPVGGVDTNAVVTAHSAWANATLFDRLPETKTGEVIYIDVLGQTLAYQVTRTDVVLPQELSSITRTPGVDAITLVTCTPRSINSHRLLVHAERIPYDGPAAPTNPLQTMSFAIQPWMMPRLIGAGAGLLLIAVMLLLAARKHRKQPRAQRAQEAS